ncbi:unnamed protein product, partial [Staurois parvus]
MSHQDSQQGRLRGSGVLIQRKVDFHFPHLFVRSILGPGAWRFQSDLGGMKSPILGPGFGNGQETDWACVPRSLLESGPEFWAPPWQTESGGLHPGRQEVSALGV